MFRRLRNLWKLSDIDPDKYSLGFKWTGYKKAVNQPEEITLTKYPATILEDDPKEMFEEHQENV